MLEENVDSKVYDVLDLILVIIERKSPSVPSRTRQGNSVSPMVLWLKPRKSRSSPELSPDGHKNRNLNRPFGRFFVGKTGFF